MRIDVRHNPSFAVARVSLDPGEELRAESGAMMATSAVRGSMRILGVTWVPRLTK